MNVRHKPYWTLELAGVAFLTVVALGCGESEPPAASLDESSSITVEEPEQGAGLNVVEEPDPNTQSQGLSIGASPETPNSGITVQPED